MVASYPEDALKMCENCAQTNSGMLIIHTICQFLLNLNLPFQEFGKLFGSLRRSLERSSKSLQEFGLSLAES